MILEINGKLINYIFDGSTNDLIKILNRKHVLYIKNEYFLVKDIEKINGTEYKKPDYNIFNLKTKLTERKTKIGK